MTCSAVEHNDEGNPYPTFTALLAVVWAPLTAELCFSWYIVSVSAWVLHKYSCGTLEQSVSSLSRFKLHLLIKKDEKQLASVSSLSPVFTRAWSVILGPLLLPWLSVPHPRCSGFGCWSSRNFSLFSCLSLSSCVFVTFSYLCGRCAWALLLYVFVVFSPGLDSCSMSSRIRSSYQYSCHPDRTLCNFTMLVFPFWGKGSSWSFLPFFPY